MSQLVSSPPRAAQIVPRKPTSDIGYAEHAERALLDDAALIRKKRCCAWSTSTVWHVASVAVRLARLLHRTRDR